MKKTPAEIRNNPWNVPCRRWAPESMVCNAQDRIAAVKQSDNADWLRQCLVEASTQTTVKTAIARRLNWLRKYRVNNRPHES
jgi:hypothetical protein